MAAKFKPTKQSALAEVAKSKAKPKSGGSTPAHNVPAPAPGSTYAIPTITPAGPGSPIPTINPAGTPVPSTPVQTPVVPTTPPANGTSSTTQQTSTPAAPFWTPEQLIQISDYDTQWKGQVQALTDTLNNAEIQTPLDLAAVQKQHDVDTANANEAAAARGLFQSSIRASDLNDIDATLTTRQNTLNTALQNLRTSTGQRLGDLATDYTNHHNAFDQEAVANAAAQTPVLPPSSTSQNSHPTGTGSAGNPIQDQGTWQPTHQPVISQAENQWQPTNQPVNPNGFQSTVKPAKTPKVQNPGHPIQSGGFKATSVKPPKGMAA